MIEISVVIPSYNASGDLNRCLDALHKSTFDLSRFEVIVVDDGSTDDTGAAVLARAVKPGMAVRYVRRDRSGGFGPGVARDVGLPLAAGFVIAFTDADCVPGPEWLQAIHDAVVRDGKPLVAGETWCDETLLFPWKMAPANHVGATANLAYDRKVVGDHRFSSEFVGFNGDDVDFVQRLILAGHRLVVVPAMRIFHPARHMTLRQVVRRSYWRCNDVLIHKKYGKAAHTWVALPFRPIFFGRFSPLAIFVFAALASLALWPAFMLQLAAVSAVPLLIFGYRFCIMYVPARPERISWPDRFKTVVFAVVYMPCLLYGRLVGSIRYRHLML